MNEQALKDRLKNIAKEESLTFSEVWKRLTLERFLVRLSKSEHSEHFIFKGGLLLSYFIKLGRETKDADFLAKGFDVEPDVIESHIKDICTINIEDGFTYTFRNIEQLAQPHMNYTGHRVYLDLTAFTMKDSLQLDLGVGDIVEPQNQTILLLNSKNGPLYENNIELTSYPLEFVVAEKLETIISKGAINSRMKDYYDLWAILTSTFSPLPSDLNSAISKTFATRGTDISLPLQYSGDDLSVLDQHWKTFLRKLPPPKTDTTPPNNIGEVLASINELCSRSLEIKPK